MSFIKNDLVSIIMPSYNSENYIEKSILSIISQTYTKWELLIIDDCSVDQSYKIALSFSKFDSRIRLIQNERNFGAAYSRNKGIEIAAGKFLMFLDSDDLWKNNKIETQITFMLKNNSDFTFAKYSLIGEDGVDLHKEVRIVKKLTYQKYLLHCFTGCLTVCFNQERLGKIYGPNIKNNNDYGLFLNILKVAKLGLGINENIGFYRIRKNSISRNKINKIKPYFELMIKHQNIIPVVAFFYLCTNFIIGKIWKIKVIK